MDRNKKQVFSFVLIAASLFMMIYGACRGEGSIVLGKAINICLECIGLG